MPGSCPVRLRQPSTSTPPTGPTARATYTGGTDEATAASRSYGRHVGPVLPHFRGSAYHWEWDSLRRCRLPIGGSCHGNGTADADIRRVGDVSHHDRGWHQGDRASAATRLGAGSRRAHQHPQRPDHEHPAMATKLDTIDIWGIGLGPPWQDEGGTHFFPKSSLHGHPDAKTETGGRIENTPEVHTADHGSPGSICDVLQLHGWGDNAGRPARPIY